MMIKFPVWPLADSGPISSSRLSPDNMQEAPESEAIEECSEETRIIQPQL